MKTETWHAEYTDTFGGEANYSWVKRATVTVPEAASRATVVRAVKRAFGLSGIRGRLHWFGDCLEFWPARSCTVVFARFAR